MALWSRQTTVGSALGRRYSIAPRNAGTFGNWARSVRKRVTSTSGLTPSSSLRYSFRKNLFLKSIDELLCSALKTCDAGVLPLPSVGNALLVRPVRFPLLPRDDWAAVISLKSALRKDSS